MKTKSIAALIIAALLSATAAAGESWIADDKNGVKQCNYIPESVDTVYMALRDMYQTDIKVFREPTTAPNGVRYFSLRGMKPTMAAPTYYFVSSTRQSCEHFLSKGAF